LRTETCRARLAVPARAPSLAARGSPPRTSAGADGGADGWRPRDGRLRATLAAESAGARVAAPSPAPRTPIVDASKTSSSAVSPRVSSSR
jgi:hypothetical protein